MRIDNSMSQMFRECPNSYQERYVNNLEKKRLTVTGLDFGTRFHQLLGQHYGLQVQTVELPQPEESEAQEMYAGYRATYPEEPFEVVEVEKYFEVPIGGEVECGCGVWEVVGEPMLVAGRGGLQSLSPTRKTYQHDCKDCKGTGRRPKHLYMGKWDGVVRMKDTGRFKIFETKSEKRNGKANTPQAWATRDQGSLYLYSGAYTFGETFDGIILNIVTRGSEKGFKPAGFRRDKIERTPEQILLAVRDITQTADDIEACTKRYNPGEPWLQHREHCTNKQTGWECDYAAIHTFGRTEELVQLHYQQGKDYLHGN